MKGYLSTIPMPEGKGNRGWDHETLEKLRSSIQSYLGHLRWASSYNLKRGLLERKIISDHFDVDGNTLIRKYRYEGGAN